MGNDNKEMLMNQAKELKHHADELMKVLKDAKDIDAWVVAKAERATTDLSDITHYLDGEEGKYEDGGMMAKGGRLDVGRYYKTKDGRQVRYLGNTKDPEVGTFMNKADGVFKVRFDEIEGQDSIFAHGGTIYVDLFEYRDEMPYKVKVIVDRYEDEYGEDISYQSLLDMQREVENEGYTFDFGLDSMPYGLRPIGVDITQLRDYDDDDYYADGGMMAKVSMFNNELFESLVEYEVSELDNRITEIKSDLKKLKGDRVGLSNISEKEYNESQMLRMHISILDAMILNLRKMKINLGTIREDGGMMARGGATSKEWVVNFSSQEGGYRKTYYVLAKSKDEAIDKGFRNLTNDGEESDEYKVDSTYTLKKEDGGMMARGGATFSDKVKSISKRLNKTKVPLKYRKEYGKYFNKKEATQSAQRIVGAITRKEK